ncbi:hypothetical protein EZJ43_01590 [Pedobacter changchengzhani]|uniref:Uncharacterized protein n=1 Tax=Pedobacter changchengzhani TaxID=2529274 RepID=A0A4R5MPS5_9SPHI|nr:hypothetical protein [Pedobacter changchengzhani]TDG37811.1 hypothetical protein EZJ43_01590 [Pedobacter changchengzhani]
MNLLFTNNQKKAVESIWILGVIIAFLQISCYFMNSYGPDNTTYDYLWKLQNWFLQSLIFAWYFYKNKKTAQGFIIQLLFLPYYIFKKDWSSYLDYHLDFDRSALIYQSINIVSFVLPLLAFCVFYFKNETKPSNVSKIKGILIQFVVTLILSFTISSDPDSLYSFIGSLTTSSLYVKDAFVCLIFILISLKMIAVLTGFFYLSNRIYSANQTINPLDEQPISSDLFKWGFLISYPILFLSIVDMSKSVFTMAFSTINTHDILYMLGNLIVLFICGRFFGSLIQFRNFSLKRYFGVVNTLSLLPLLNLGAFFTLLYYKKSPVSITEYKDKLKPNRNIHLIIYCSLLTLYYLYNYFSKPADYRTFEPLYKLLVFGVSIIVLARFKWSTKVIPFLAVIILYFSDIKDFFDFGNGLWPFFKDKVFSFLWLGTLATFILYYIVDYILHKCFYTAYFEEHNPDKFEAYIEKFQ